MNSTRTRFLPLIPLLILALVAFAGAKEPVHGPTTYVPQADEGSRAEGDDCSSPIIIGSLPYFGTGLSNCGRGNTYSETCLGNYDGGEDIMFRLDLAEAATIKITMNPLGTTWTGIAIGNTCPPAASCIAFNTGSSGIRTISQLNLEAGTYYIMVDTWPTPNCVPNFDLTVEFDTPPPPPPSNDLCEDAIDLQLQGLVEFQVDLCAATNSYNAAAVLPSCTGYASAGRDVVYKIYLEAGENFTISQQGAHDSAIWLVTDCSDPAGTCVAGADATLANQVETIAYTAPAAGWYYAIIDGYGVDACSVTTVWVDAPVATTEANWSTVKSLYR